MIRVRQIILWAALSTVLLAGCSERQQDEQHEPAPRAKNLLLICIDTVRADTYFQIAALGDDSLSAWEKKALVYSNAYAPAPWTVPTVGSVFTGLLPAHHGAGLFPGLYGLMGKTPPSPMRGDVPTIASAALGAGYDTAVVSASSWTNGNIGLKHLMDGFSEFTAFETPGTEADWRPVVSAWVENDLQRAEGGNFLHFLHLMEAHNWHANFDPDMEAIYDSLTEQQLQEYQAMVPPGACDEPVTKICPGFYVYAHAVRAMRSGIAKVLDTLQRENLLNDTVVVVFSDHGEEFMDHLGDHRMAESDEPIVAVFESVGHGSSLYQEMINVPLLIWHPDYKGAQIDAPVSLTDIAPSVIRWMGLEQDAPHWQGEYLDDAARGNQAPGRTIIGSALSDGEQQLSAVHDNKKAIWYLVSDHVDYFDLVTDPGETDSIRDDKLVLAFDGMFLDYMQNVPKKAVAKSSKLTDEQIRRLQSIGYLQGVDTDAEAGELGASQ